MQLEQKVSAPSGTPPFLNYVDDPFYHGQKKKKSGARPEIPACTPLTVSNDLFQNDTIFIDSDILLGRAKVLFQFGFQFCDDFGMGFQEEFYVFSALADAFTLVAVPGTGLIQKTGFYGAVQNIAGLGNAFADTIQIFSMSLEIQKHFSNEIDYLVIDKQETSNISSTVVDLTISNLKVLRQGDIIIN